MQTVVTVHKNIYQWFSAQSWTDEKARIPFCRGAAPALQGLTVLLCLEDQETLLLAWFSVTTGSVMLQVPAAFSPKWWYSGQKIKDWCRGSKSYIGREDAKRQSTMLSTSGARTIIFWGAVNQESKTAFLFPRHNPCNAEDAPQTRNDYFKSQSHSTWNQYSSSR